RLFCYSAAQYALSPARGLPGAQFKNLYLCGFITPKNRINLQLIGFMALHNKIDGRLLKEKMRSAAENRTTVSFYKYHRIADPADFRNTLYKNFDDLRVLGRVYIASEGINAQISVPSERLNEFRDYLYSISILDGVRL